MNAPKPEVTLLLRAWGAGDPQAFDRLVPLVYEQLQAMAARSLRSERAGHTLSATAVVHEAFLRLVDADVPWNDRIHFFAVAAQVMRRVLVDHAKSLRRGKRGGGAERVALDDVALVSPQASEQVLEVDEALSRLAALDERKSRLLELLYFGGLTYTEAATALGVSEATVHREVKLAKAWLRHELKREAR
jgi:RNA polymerase sigma factor (TIGR02999 family)